MNSPCLDEDICYSALTSRDNRFDGQFFTCVKTTGIYCRISCPAKTPKRHNVEFVQTAAEASVKGFRPCLRCRPELAPGVDWSGRSKIVSQAMRYIEGQSAAEFSVEALAEQLGISSRQLRRVFLAHMGATPQKVIQTRRLHLAKQLLSETQLTATQVAFAAGYQSVRRFNDEVLKTWQRTPTDMRKNSLVVSGERFEIRLDYREPFAWDELLAFLHARTIAGVELVSEGLYTRTVQCGEEVGRISIRKDKKPGGLLLAVDLNLAKHLAYIVAQVRRMFDLDSAPDEVAKVLSKDPRMLAGLGAFPGLRVPGAWSGFECAVRAILGQQVSVQAATTLSGRVVERLGTLAFDDDVDPCYLFPTPQIFISGNLDGLGITTRRIASIKHLAEACESGQLNFNRPQSADELESEMVTLPGIGPWTAQYVAMRVARDPDAFPAGDLVLQKSVTVGERLSEKQLTQRAEVWRPWRAYACLYLWKTYHSGGGG